MQTVYIYFTKSTRQPIVWEAENIEVKEETNFIHIVAGKNEGFFNMEDCAITILTEEVKE